MRNKWKIINKRILIKPIYPKPKTKSGLIIANYEDHSKYTREVYSNQGVIVDNGAENTSTEFNIGDEVLFLRWGATAIKLDGEEFFLLKEQDIILKTNEPNDI